MPTPPKLPDGDPGKPGQTFEAPIPPTPPPVPGPAGFPTVKPLDFNAIADAAAPKDEPEPGYRGQLINQANRMDQIRQIQATYDQATTHVQTLARGEPWMYPGQFGDTAKSTIAFVKQRRDVLRLAADMADAALSQIETDTGKVESHMKAKHDQDNPPPLTDAAGNPHPLIEGGYVSDDDPNKAAEESDVNALKSGHTTKAQADAIAKADLSTDSGGAHRPGTSPVGPAGVGTGAGGTPAPVGAVSATGVEMPEGGVIGPATPGIVTTTNPPAPPPGSVSNPPVAQTTAAPVAPDTSNPLANPPKGSNSGKK